MHDTPRKDAKGNGREAGGRSLKGLPTSCHATGLGQLTRAQSPPAASRVPTATQLDGATQDACASRTEPGRWIGMKRQKEPFHRSATNRLPADRSAKPNATQNVADEHDTELSRMDG